MKLLMWATNSGSERQVMLELKHLSKAKGMCIDDFLSELYATDPELYNQIFDVINS